MQRTFFRYFLLLIIILVLLSAGLVARGQEQFPAPAGPRFDAQIDMTQRDRITKRRPDLVLLGNSMVGVNVDTVALADSLGESVLPIVYNGSGSAMWYLSIKNNILVSPHKPKVLVILFRDTYLTVPEFHADGKYIEMLEPLAGENESVLIQRAYVNLMNPLDLLAQRFLPSYRSGGQARSRVDSLIQYSLPHILLRCDQPCVDSNFQKTFNFLALITPANNDVVAQAETPLYTERALDFHSQVEQSFLPEIIRLCHENGIRLILVRGKTVYFNYNPKPAGLDQYMHDLKNYLTQNGVFFADLEADTRLTTSDFADRFHVFPEARATYTQMLAEAILPLLP